MALPRVLSMFVICLRIPSSIVLVFVALASVTLTQTPGPPPVPTLITPANPTNSAKPLQQDIDPGEIIRVDTTEVLLPVTVRDRNGQLVPGLTRKDFHVFEEGIEQPLSDLGLRQVAVDAALMVDTSSSVAGNLDDFRRAASGFAGALAPDDRVSLVQFDDRVLLLQDWTTSRVQFRRSLQRVAPGMFTRFNDAIVLTAREQFHGNNTRHALIILTDGIDSGRGLSYDAAMQAALRAQLAIYVISNIEIERVRQKKELNGLLGGSDSAVRFNQLRIDDLRLGLAELTTSEGRLVALTNATGGRLYKPASFDDLDQTYAEVAGELRHQYTLYYSPVNKARDGRFRRVQVEGRESGYHISTRAGYFGPK
jgi:Ca-activated chloride channel family protein